MIVSIRSDPISVHLTKLERSFKELPPLGRVRGTLSGGQCVEAHEKPLFLFSSPPAASEEKGAWGHLEPRQGDPCTPSVNAY